MASKLPRLQTKLKYASDVADYGAFLRSRFPHVEIVGTREKLFNKVINDFGSSPWFGVEFGVAWGYTTKWFSSRSKSLSGWYGFDLFTGLPESWREHGVGAFSNDGSTPKIDDERIHWVVGDVNKTAKEFDFSKLIGKRKAFFFDLDLFEPSLSAWIEVKKVLEPGDYVYLDEALDADERRLLNEHMLTEFNFVCVGATYSSLLLMVAKP